VSKGVCISTGVKLKQNKRKSCTNDYISSFLKKFVLHIVLSPLFAHTYDLIAVMFSFLLQGATVRIAVFAAIVIARVKP